jgi:hypothetical protein
LLCLFCCLSSSVVVLVPAACVVLLVFGFTRPVAVPRYRLAQDRSYERAPQLW